MKGVRVSRDHERGQGQQGSLKGSGSAGIMIGDCVNRDLRGVRVSRDHGREQCQQGS
jgi:hypothetical protein